MVRRGLVSLPLTPGYGSSASRHLLKYAGANRYPRHLESVAALQLTVVRGPDEEVHTVDLPVGGTLRIPTVSKGQILRYDGDDWVKCYP